MTLTDIFVEHPKIDLFISYRRSDAEAHAIALRQWLRRYRLPKALQTEERHRELEIYLDEVNVRANSDFMNEIVPALGKSRYLLIVHTEDALKTAPNGEINWLVRELRVFRHESNRRRNQVVAAIAGSEFNSPLPDGLDRDLPRIERLDIREITSFWRWWPPRRLRIENELLPLVATLRDIKPEEMTILRREAERTATSRLVAMFSSAFVTISILAVALVWALNSQVQATRSNFEAQFSRVFANRSAADSLVVTANTAEERGDYLGAVRLLTEAKSLAWTPRVQAAALSLEEPLATFDHTVGISAWRTAFSPSGKLAIGGYDGEVVLYDPENKTQISIREPDGIPVVNLAFEANGALLIVLRSPADAAWNQAVQSESISRLERIMPSGEILEIDALPSGADFLSAASNDDGSVLVVGAEDGVWLRDPGALDWLYLGAVQSDSRSKAPATVEVSAQGQYVSAATIDGGITVWRLEDRQVLVPLRIPKPEDTYPYNPSQIEFIEPGPDLLFGAFDGGIHRWRLTTDAEATSLNMRHERAVTAVASNADGSIIATGGWDAEATIWNISSGRPPQKLKVGTEGLMAGVMDISLSPDGTLLATTAAVPESRNIAPGSWLFGDVQIWKLSNTNSITPTAHRAWWNSSFDRNGGLLSAVVSGSVNLVREGQEAAEAPSVTNVWDPVAESQMRRDPIKALNTDDTARNEGDYSIVSFDQEPGEIVSGSIGFSPSGQRAAYLRAEVGADGNVLINPEIVLLDVGTAEVLKTDRLSLAAVRAFGPLLFFDDETVLAALIASPDTPDGQRGSHIWYWRMTSDRAERLVSLEDHSIFDMTTSQKNAMIAISDDSHSVMAFDLTGREIWRADDTRRHANSPAQLAFSPDGQTLFAVAFAQLHKWQIGHGWKEISGSADIYFKPEDIAVDPLGRLLILPDLDGTIRFIDASSFQLLSVLQLHIGPLLTVEISPDGRRMVAIGVGGRRVLGGILPESVEIAERVSGLTVRAGALARLDAATESRLVSRHPYATTSSVVSPADLEFLRLLRSGEVSVHEPATWIEWVRAKEPLILSERMEAWLVQNPNHPFSANLLQFLVHSNQSN